MRKKHLKFFSIMTISMLLITTVFTGCKKSQSSVNKIRLNEVARSVFYAPMYAAMNQGFFKEEGLEIDLSTGQGADKTMQQVLSGSADIGFCGPEQTIYIFNQKREDQPIIFAQLTQKDGSFLVGRKAEPNFKWSDIKGKNVIGGRPGGVPQMAFEYVLKNNGIDPTKDINLINNIAYDATAGAFVGGTGDYVTLFEPSGSVIEKANNGHIVTSIGASAGVIPYTCFFANESYITKHPDIIQKFTNAIYRGQLWMNGKTDKEVAESIISFFPGTDLDIISNVVKNYRAIDAIAANPSMKAEDMNRLMDIIQLSDSKLITERPNFDKIATNKFAEEAMKNIK
jgi:NitT/TauT family transport system substrate-binding protein